MSVERVNRVPHIIKKLGWDRKQFIKEAQYHADLSWPTAAKWADGDTDVDLDSLERLSVWLNIPKDELLVTRRAS